MGKTTIKFAHKVRVRAVWTVFDHERDHPSSWATVVSIADKIGCVPQTLHERVKKAEVDNGKCAGVPADVADKVKALERDVRELRQANDSGQGIRIFRPGGAQPPVLAMISFFDDHREADEPSPACDRPVDRSIEQSQSRR